MLPCHLIPSPPPPPLRMWIEIEFWLKAHSCLNVCESHVSMCSPFFNDEKSVCEIYWWKTRIMENKRPIRIISILLSSNEFFANKTNSIHAISSCFSIALNLFKKNNSIFLMQPRLMLFCPVFSFTFTEIPFQKWSNCSTPNYQSPILFTIKYWITKRQQFRSHWISVWFPNYQPFARQRCYASWHIELGSRPFRMDSLDLNWKVKWMWNFFPLFSRKISLLTTFTGNFFFAFI